LIAAYRASRSRAHPRATCSIASRDVGLTFSAASFAGAGVADGAGGGDSWCCGVALATAAWGWGTA